MRLRKWLEVRIAQLPEKIFIQRLEKGVAAQYLQQKVRALRASEALPNEAPIMLLSALELKRKMPNAAQEEDMSQRRIKETANFSALLRSKTPSSFVQCTRCNVR